MFYIHIYNGYICVSAYIHNDHLSYSMIVLLFDSILSIYHVYWLNLEDVRLFFLKTHLCVFQLVKAAYFFFHAISPSPLPQHYIPGFKAKHKCYSQSRI